MLEIYNKIKDHCEVLNKLTGENTTSISNLKNDTHVTIGLFQITFYGATPLSFYWDYKIIDEHIISVNGRPLEYKSDFLFFVSALIPYSISNGIHDSVIRLEKLKLLDL